MNSGLLFNIFFKAFLRVHETLKERMAATVWLFETGDFHVMCDADIAFSDESVPPGKHSNNEYKFVI